MSFVRVNVKPDTLDEENRKFAQKPLNEPLFLNSVPKSGSHLLRNIIRMFVPVERQYQAEFIQHHFIQQHLAAFDPRAKMLSWGHLYFTEAFKALLADVRKILLVRDPYDWVLAQARFVGSNEFQVPGLDRYKRADTPVDELLNLVIQGTKPQLAPLQITYHYNAVAWLSTAVHLVRYEELVGALAALDSTESESYFKTLLEACGIDCPTDWKDRVRIGSDRKQSGTARENLTSAASQIPSELPEPQKKMVDQAYPGLRNILRYP